MGMTRLEYLREIIELIDEECLKVSNYFFPYVVLKRVRDCSKIDKKTTEFKEDILKLIKNIE